MGTGVRNGDISIPIAARCISLIGNQTYGFQDMAQWSTSPRVIAPVDGSNPDGGGGTLRALDREATCHLQRIPRRLGGLGQEYRLAIPSRLDDRATKGGAAGIVRSREGSKIKCRTVAGATLLRRHRLTLSIINHGTRLKDIVNTESNLFLLRCLLFFSL